MEKTTMFCVSRNRQFMRFFTHRKLAEQWIEENPEPGGGDRYWEISEWALHTYGPEAEQAEQGDSTAEQERERALRQAVNARLSLQIEAADLESAIRRDIDKLCGSKPHTQFVLAVLRGEDPDWETWDEQAAFEASDDPSNLRGVSSIATASLGSGDEE